MGMHKPPTHVLERVHFVPVGMPPAGLGRVTPTRPPCVNAAGTALLVELIVEVLVAVATVVAVMVVVVVVVVVRPLCVTAKGSVLLVHSTVVSLAPPAAPVVAAVVAAGTRAGSEQHSHQGQEQPGEHAGVAHPPLVVLEQPVHQHPLVTDAGAGAAGCGSPPDPLVTDAGAGAAGCGSPPGAAGPKAFAAVLNNASASKTAAVLPPTNRRPVKVAAWPCSDTTLLLRGLMLRIDRLSVTRRRRRGPSRFL